MPIYLRKKIILSELFGSFEREAFLLLVPILGYKTSLQEAK